MGSGGSGARWPALALTCALSAAGCRDRSAPPDAGPPADAGPPPEKVVRVLRGHAVWYGGDWHGKKTASGERFDRHAFTAAHRSLPLGTRVRVTDLRTRRQVIVRVNDRGPYGPDRRRIIDLSEAAARELGFLDRGSTRVNLEVLAPRPEQVAGDAGPGPPAQPPAAGPPAGGGGGPR
jgi:rare lipoprotein A